MILQALQYVSIVKNQFGKIQYKSISSHKNLSSWNYNTRGKYEECATTANKDKSEKLQGSLTNYGYSTDRISIAISKDKFLNLIIDLCTINLCPFSIVEYFGKQ